MEYPVITIDDFDYIWFKKIKLEVQKRGRTSYMQTKYFKHLITGFDIETSKLYFLNGEFITAEQVALMDKSLQDSVETEAIMYIWQWHFNKACTVVGRTWDEFLEFAGNLAKCMGEVEKLAVFVHDLSHEFQYLRGIYPFKNEEIFATDKRKILKCTMFDGKIEFRCSYMLTNMSLSQATQKYKVEHGKLSGDEFNYNITRYPWTPLTEREMEYCINDVIGLCEVVEVMLKNEQDTLASMPMTSTGYVRREAKRAMRPWKWVIQDIFPDLELFQELREAFRGGDTHANRYYANKKIEHVKSFDRSSSYPDVMANCKFPMGKFFKVRQETVSVDEILDLIDRRGKAVLTRCAIKGLRLLDKFWGSPYFSESKCRNIENAVIDNGRVLSADYLETTITDVDLDIMLNEYDWDEIVFFDVYHTKYDYLPKQYIDLIHKYYTRKTSLKDVKGAETEYEKEKNKFNSLYGMFVQNPLIIPLIYQPDKKDPTKMKFDYEENPNLEELLQKYKKNAFITYQWGVWTTAWARLRLHELMWIVGEDFIYSDTDSVKFIGDHMKEIMEYNKKRIADSKKSGSFATDSKGVIHYMGVYENDYNYSMFKTLGAKKYAYIEEGSTELHITIAGVGKSSGAEELLEKNGLDSFEPGFVFKKGGGTESIYNDIFIPFTRMTPEGNVTITSNVAIVDSTYKLTMNGDYTDLVENSAILWKLIEAHELMETGTIRHAR